MLITDRQAAANVLLYDKSGQSPPQKHFDHLGDEKEEKICLSSKILDVPSPLKLNAPIFSDKETNPVRSLKVFT